MTKRYYVRACDNDDNLEPAPPRNRTWDVIDRKTDGVVCSDLYTRAQARKEAARLNAKKEDDDV